MAIACVVCSLQVAVAQPRAVELTIEAPAELASVAAELQSLNPQRLVQLQTLLGLGHPGEALLVVLAPEDSTAAQNTPRWIVGYAHGALGRVVIFPERTPSYPNSSLEEVLLHEIAHVLIARAAGFQPVPRWFNEGLAMAVSGAWGLDDRTWLTWGALVNREIPISSLDRHFSDQPGPTRRAYAISGAFLRDLMGRARPNLPAEVLARLSRGQSFDDAFRLSLGVTVDQAGAAFWDRHSFWYRWVPMLTSSFTLWVAIVLLALAAGWRKQKQRVLLEETWDRQDYEEPEDHTVN